MKLRFIGINRFCMSNNHFCNLIRTFGTPKKKSPTGLNWIYICYELVKLISKCYFSTFLAIGTINYAIAIYVFVNSYVNMNFKHCAAVTYKIIE